MSDPTHPFGSERDLSETPVIEEATGEIKGMARGLKEFADGWERDVELPHQIQFDAWQMCDEDHPPEGGAPAYRVVHKTIRTIPFPNANIDLQTLLLRLANGEVTMGQPVFHDTLPSRREGKYLVPEWGFIQTDNAGAMSYRYSESSEIHIEGHQETLPPANYVEILCHLPTPVDGGYADQLAAGRARVAPLLVVLDLLFGERLLGPILTEEIGEVFEDWHWNRRLGGRSVAIEAQARREHINGQTFADQLRQPVTRLLALDDEERLRVRVASQWYWRAEIEADNVVRFVGYWLVIEALELGENAKIGPLKDSVARMLGVERSLVSERVGRLYGLRNKLLHGKQGSATNEDVDQVRSVAVALLASHALGDVSTDRIIALREAVCS